MHEASMFQYMLVYTPVTISSYLSTTFDSDSTYFDPSVLGIVVAFMVMV